MTATISLITPLLGVCTIVCGAHAGELAVQRLATFSYSDDDTQPTSLISGSDGSFYGTTSGDRSTNGTVFKLNPNGELTVLVSLDPDGTNGCCPGALVQAPDGSFYGATGSRQALDFGGIFHLAPSGELRTIFHFNDAKGQSARILLYGTDGNLYGTTSSGGNFGYGTIFKLTPTGEHTTLFSFARTNGINPTSLVRSSDGTLFGTTSDWIGVNAPDTVFRLSPSGEFTTLSSSFTGGPVRPWSVILGTDGNLYGLDRVGGSNHFGSIFKMTPTGTMTTLAEFDGTNGWDPDRLIQGADGNLYGATAAGGADYMGWIPADGGFIGSGSGTIFKVTPNGELARLASLLEMPGDDVVGFVQGADGVFYGARTSGGPPEPAGVFRAAPPPVITGLTCLEGKDILSWSSFRGGVYQVEYRATCATEWVSLPPAMVAVGNETALTNSVGASAERYYRVRLLP
jgi:uncharacterized repeat protein (TIGR03803 family)